MDARAFLFAMGALFVGNALLGIVLLRYAPAQASLVAVLAAVAMAVGVAVIAWRMPQMAAAGCSACGHPRDPALAFCVRCGRAHA